FLYTLTQEQLRYTRFPLGEMTKDEARKIAAAQGLITARKHDSQDICFVPDGRYADFIEAYTGKKYPEGDFTDKDGNVLGRHKGIIRYTVGQRKRLGIALGEPAYVLRVNPEDNTVTLGSNEDLFSQTLEADRINLISCERIEAPIRVRAKIRNRHKEQWATAEQVGDDRIRVIFDEPQRAITPGQAVVLYDGDVVVGGGTIL
ncbi:MAG: tRNA 2-thiouridine(34) synthase MnmA, partial [Clostridia bacterium]|nr:tRNA 2-thiouridine(34) synthase MnmA [Clostridia bacterium]